MPSLRLPAYFLKPPAADPGPPAQLLAELAAAQVKLGAFGYRPGKREQAVHILGASLKEQAPPTGGLGEAPPVPEF